MSEAARTFEEEAQTLLPDLETIGRARAWVDEAAASAPGAVCPCCASYVKVYRTAPVGVSVLSLHNLVALWRAGLRMHMGRERERGNLTPSPYDRFLHLSEFQATAMRDSNFAALARWELVTQEPNEDSSKRTSGRWQPTRRGLDFIDGKVTIPRYVLTRDNRVLGFEGEQVSARDLIGKRFDYAELQAANARGVHQVAAENVQRGADAPQEEEPCEA